MSKCLGFLTALLVCVSPLTPAYALEQNPVFEACPTESASPEAIPPLPAYDRMILVPGAAGQGTDLYVGPLHWSEYFSAYVPFLEKAGIPFSLHSVSETGDENIQTRIENLFTEVKQAQRNHEHVVLYGHSMGGLVSRLVLRDPSVWDTIVATITISTPHRGTELVDALLKSDAFIPWVSLLSRIVGFDIHQKNYLTELSQARAADYALPEDFAPGMPPIYSIVSADSLIHLYEGIPAFGIGAQWIKHEIDSLPDSERARTGIWETASDGIVPAYSQVWGHCLGLFHANHAKALGKVIRSSQTAEFAQFMTQLTGFLKPNTLIPYETDARSHRPSSSSSLQ